MSARLALLNGIKRALRARKVTYRELAKSIGVSEATVKRDLSRGSFSLLRLDEICSSLGLTLSDLTQRPEAAEVITRPQRLPRARAGERSQGSPRNVSDRQ